MDVFKKEARRTAAAVETEKKRAIGYRLLIDSLRKKKEQDQRRLMVSLKFLQIKLRPIGYELRCFSHFTGGD